MLQRRQELSQQLQPSPEVASSHRFPSIVTMVRPNDQVSRYAELGAGDPEDEASSSSETSSDLDSVEHDAYVPSDGNAPDPDDAFAERLVDEPGLGKKAEARRDLDSDSSSDGDHWWWDAEEPWEPESPDVPGALAGAGAAPPVPGPSGLACAGAAPPVPAPQVSPVPVRRRRSRAAGATWCRLPRVRPGCGPRARTGRK